ncbi:MAG: ChrR family anti-sigma-E factor [Rhodospirillaceae bacterium]|nr:ChrR family anti-sigma-E factor [Rhodospirillaceae bacterium]
MALNHHPHEDTLWAYATGNLDEASGVLVATHLALCPACRREVAALEATGGAMFESIDAAPMAGNAFEKLMARVEAETGPRAANSNAKPIRTAPAVGGNSATVLPRPLRDYVGGDLDAFAWRRMTAGVDYVDLPVNAEGRRARLLRIAPGTRVPTHGHGGEEMTMVLAGGYSDASGSFARGDVQTADESTVHQPVADPGEPCICLTVTRGPLMPTGVLSILTKLFPRLGA